MNFQQRDAVFHPAAEAPNPEFCQGARQGWGEEFYGQGRQVFLRPESRPGKLPESSLLSSLNCLI